MPDENDIVYDTYQLDLVGILKRAAESIFGGGFEGFFDTLGHWWDIYSIVALLFSLLCFVGFIYAKIRFEQMKEIENQLIAEEEKAWQHLNQSKTGESSRWNDVQAHIASENPNDWRLAIIEADVMLAQTLDEAGYVGASIGDKLKTANPSSFTTVQDAWDAHKIRNEIAHAGSDFVLTKRIAQEAIAKYERVFREFGVL